MNKDHIVYTCVYEWVNVSENSSNSIVGKVNPLDLNKFIVI